jgi:ADP-heptose:LPS heptosyltransferase
VLHPEDLPSLKLPQLTRPADLPERFATLQVKAGWSAYKNWPVERWAAVLRACPEIPVYQIGRVDEPRVPGARHQFMGSALPVAVALVGNASLPLGVDSFDNHLTHFQWETEGSAQLRRVPAVILWGSTQASAAGYPHNVNISLGLHCQPCFREDPAISSMPRGVCINPPGQTYAEPRHACMFGIAVDQVTREVQRIWTGTEPV